jgi:hypothetical protein
MRSINSALQIRRLATLEHDAPKLTDFGDNIMLHLIKLDHVYDFGLIQSKITVIYVENGARGPWNQQDSATTGNF